MLCSRSNSKIGNERCLSLASSSRRQSVEEQVILPIRESRYRGLNESNRTSEEDTESVCSVQAYETELVQDTPDTDTKSENDSTDEIEYEVASLSETKSDPVVDSSSSGADDILTAAGVIAAVLCDSSREDWLTDGEDSDNSSIEEMVLKRKDFWTCVQCKSQNNNPSFRFCQKCFQVRKSNFPPRPRSQRKKKTNQPCITFNKNSQSNPTLLHDSGVGSSQDILPLDLNMPNTSKESLTNVNSPGRKRKHSSALYDHESPLNQNNSDTSEEFLNSSSSQARKRKKSSAIHDKEDPLNLKVLNSSSLEESLNNETKETSSSKLPTHTKENSLDLNLPNTSEKHLNNESGQGRKRKNSTSVYDENQKKVKVEDEVDRVQKCIICNIHGRNSIFLHRNIGHLYCCYKCAKHCWNTTKKCPICNRKIEQVVKVFC